MEHSALSNKRGYSLIEVLIALCILAIVFAALMKSSLLVIQKNSQNEIRDEAVRLGEETMDAIRFSPTDFDASAPTQGHLDLYVEDYTWDAAPRVIRGGTVQYTIRKVVTWLDVNDKQVLVTIGWKFQGHDFSHTVLSFVRRPGA